MKKSVPLLLVIGLGLLACGGARAVSERNILEWGHVLNVFMATNMENANSYPIALDEVDPMLRQDLKDTDGWGNKLLYRRLRIDKYNLISAGADGEFGNEDDIIMENGALYAPAKIYAENPLKQ